MIPRLSRRMVITVALSTLAAGLFGVGPAASQTPGIGQAPDAAAQPGKILYAELPADEIVPNSYVVSLGANTKPEDVDRLADELTAAHGGEKGFSYAAALPGFSLRADASVAARMARDSRVEYVAQDIYATTSALVVQPNPPSWGLDRIDERSLPRDFKYHYPNTAPSVNAFIIDTGIQLNHVEFGGSAICGFDPYLNGCNPCNAAGMNHGTHVAGTVGGQATGVAKDVRLIAVRVFNCLPSTPMSVVIAGVNFVTLSQQLNPTQRSVANMSLGGSAYLPLDTAVATSIANNVHYSVAAGNSGADACNFSPARVAQATTAGATTITDARPVWSNYGTCVDLFAPGENIFSASTPFPNSYATLSGTSMSAPHATGTAALWRHKFPADTALQVAAALNGNATPGVVTNLPAVPASPNLLLFMAMVPV